MSQILGTRQSASLTLNTELAADFYADVALGANRRRYWKL